MPNVEIAALCDVDESVVVRRVEVSEVAKPTARYTQVV